MATSITGHVVSPEMQELRDQLEVLVEQLSRLADAKRMYGNVRPVPGSRHIWPAPGGARSPHTGITVASSTGDLYVGASITMSHQGGVTQAPGQVRGASTVPPTTQCSPDSATAVATASAATVATSAATGSDCQMADAATATARKGVQAAMPEHKPEAAEEVDVEALLQQADACSSRMLALLADKPHAATSQQPLRGAALLAAALSAYLRGGGTCDTALRALQAAVKLQPRNPTAWNCLTHSYWERGDLFMASCCLNSGLRHCPSVAAHQMMSLLVRQQRGASGAALLQRQRQQQQQQQQPDAPQKPHSRGAGLTATAATTGACGSGGYGVPSGEDASLMSAALTASLAHARRALELDLENGYSWYVLAMAQMADYFQGEHHPPGRGGGGGEGGGGTGPGMGPSVHISGSGDGCRARGRGGRGDLHRVMAAFAQAERCGCSNLPDLYYNRAALHAFVQDFEAALHDYSRAASLDPGLPAPAQMESLLVLLGQLSGLVAARGGVRDRNWAAVTALLAGDSVRVSELLPFIHHERLAVRTIRDLQPGPNRGLAVLCRALVFVSPTLNASGTLYLVCVDAGGCCFVLALTHIYHDAFDMTQLLTIVHPEMRQVDVTWPPPACNTAATPASSPALSPPSPHRSHAAAAIATAATTADPATANASPDSESRSSSWDSAIQGAVASMGAGAATGMESRVGPGPALRQAPLPSTSMAVPSRTYRFPLLMVGCDPGCRSAVLVDGVPVHQAPQTPLLRHVMRAA